MSKMNLKVRGVIFALVPQYDQTNPRGEEMVEQMVQRLKQLDEERPEVILMREPENLKDPKAVRVYCEGTPIGYVAHEQTDEAHLLFDTLHSIVPARIVGVDVERKGNFYIEAELPEGAFRKQFAKAEPTNAWKDWRCSIPKLPMPEVWKNCQVLEFQIERLLPDPAPEQMKNLKMYIKLWIDKSLHDFSVEAMQLRMRYISRLRAVGNGLMEVEAKRLEKQFAAICSAQRMTYRMKWWKEIQRSESMERYWDRWRSSRKEDNLWKDLHTVDVQLRRMPDGLYAHIGDLTCLFSALRYRDDVTREVLWDIYTLLLLRERICLELGVAMKPLPENAYGVEAEGDENGHAMETTGMHPGGAAEDEGLFCPFTEEQQKDSGIRVRPDVVLGMMHALRSKYVQKVDWLSFYCVLLRRRWVDDNLRAWCRTVESLFGLSLDNHALSRVLKKDGADYHAWTDADERILRRKQLAADFDTRLTEYFERKRAKVMEGIRE